MIEKNNLESLSNSEKNTLIEVFELLTEWNRELFEWAPCENVSGEENVLEEPVFKVS